MSGRNPEEAKIVVMGHRVKVSNLGNGVQVYSTTAPGDVLIDISDRVLQIVVGMFMAGCAIGRLSLEIQSPTLLLVMLGLLCTFSAAFRVGWNAHQERVEDGDNGLIFDRYGRPKDGACTRSRKLSRRPNLPKGGTGAVTPER